MNSTQSRISVVAACFVGGFTIVLLHLWILMVQQHETWARRSNENRWAFRSVPSQRGEVLDRNGHLLARDEPTMQLSLHYQRFRISHPVGAAVHAATTWASLNPGAEGTRYGMLGVVGPMRAAEDLLAMPARVLRRGALPKSVASDLSSTITTVLSACSGQSRKRVFAAVRTASDARGDVAIGDLMPVPRAQLLAAFARRLASLQRFDDELRSARRERLARAGLPDDGAPGLMDVLDELRRASLEQRRMGDGGRLVETIRRVFDDHVPFELAASLRIGAEHHPGLEISPSIERVQSVAPGTSLRALLGGVADLDRTDRSWLDRMLVREMPEDWLDDLVPAALAGGEEERALLQLEARERYERAMLLEERRGTTGIEAAFNDTLMGRLGLRLVERDGKRREQLLWSHLRVEAGAPIRITIDRDLQEVAERAAAAAYARVVGMYSDDVNRGKVQASLAVIDTETGDVLAFAGAPIESGLARKVPGVMWNGIGYVGSVVKPFVLVEHLQALAAGRAHVEPDAIEPCSGKLAYGGITIKCGHAHWDEGKDPVGAIAKSCNSYFGQCAIGLGEEGFARALRRFGLLKPSSDGDPFVACWQPTVRGVPISAPVVDRNTVLPRRGIGYGVDATPLAVARAYAALATGSLPTLGVLFGPARPRVPLDLVDGELEIVRRGLQRCVESGTADGIPSLARHHVAGKTGTAEVGDEDQNNAWFAGFLPSPGPEGVRLCFCSVIYWVPDKVHGGDAAGRLVGEFLDGVHAAPELDARYLLPEGGR